MNTEDYEKAKQECWEQFCDNVVYSDSPDYEYWFDDVWDKAYHFGMETTKKEQQKEPKFKVGDKVSVNYPTGKRMGFIKQFELDGTYDVSFEGGSLIHNISEDLIEPYTEPQEDKNFDNIIKDSFLSHNRLQIAAMAMAGILSNEESIERACDLACGEKDVRTSSSAIAKYALACADALFKEVEKGGQQ